MYLMYCVFDYIVYLIILCSMLELLEILFYSIIYCFIVKRCVILKSILCIVLTLTHQDFGECSV